ncbi:lytic transglycosylase domain-containing protein [Ectothiorhodospiraceae bacterium BW-2]|nr:lytic transglycosylase domain-containing protein [Ectothiorhodospiraceae bacterium BW-2]
MKWWQSCNSESSSPPPLLTLLWWLALLISSAALPSETNSPSLDPALKSALSRALSQQAAGVDEYDLQVWLTDYDHRLRHYVKDPKERSEILRYVWQEAHLAKLEPELVLAVIHTESLFDRFAISRVGARGLMQIMPFWLEELNRPYDNLFQIETNLRFGCTILRHYLDIEQGQLTPALARYNGSYGSNRYPNKVYERLRRYWYKS